MGVKDSEHVVFHGAKEDVSASIIIFHPFAAVFFCGVRFGLGEYVINANIGEGEADLASPDEEFCVKISKFVR